MNLSYIKKTYCLSSELFIGNGILGVKLKSQFNPHMTFIGVGSLFVEARENCVEVFEFHQELFIKGLLPKNMDITKNLN